MTNQDENLDDIISSLIDFEEDEQSPSVQEAKTELSGEPITLTERAAKQVSQIIAKEGLDSNLFLRVAVEGGGCSGLSYKLGLDYRTDQDVVFYNFGVEVIVDPKHLMV